ncbi:hypothetical protein GY45DRAFT_1138548 [Cubamyces sp. BRFM 1775]|nr:hypothetical protein GY45DRAFT_1138548 [Cubamyces sp. BRFM 1775]
MCIMHTDDRRMYLLFRRHASALYRAFGNPFGGGGDECSGFHPPWDFECSQSTSTTSTHEATSTTKTAAPVPTQTTVVVSSTVITSVTVVTSGSTTTAETTLITGTTVTSAITPTPPPSGSSSSGTATEPSATDESPSVSNSSEPTALPDRTTIGSDISPLPTPLSPSPSIQTTTVSTTLSPTGASSGQQQVHNLSGGDIAAICIACLSVLGLSVIILRASKKRAANAGRRSSHSTYLFQSATVPIVDMGAQAPQVRTPPAPHHRQMRPITVLATRVVLSLPETRVFLLLVLWRRT